MSSKNVLYTDLIWHFAAGAVNPRLGQ